MKTSNRGVSTSVICGSSVARLPRRTGGAPLRPFEMPDLVPPDLAGVFQQLLAVGLAFEAKLLRGFFDCLEEDRIWCCRGIRHGVHPRRKRLRAGCEASRGLPAADGRRDALQVVVKFGEMVEGVAEPHEAGSYRGQVGGFERERFENEERLSAIRRRAPRLSAPAERSPSLARPGGVALLR